MNIDEKVKLYNRVKDSAGAESVEKKAIEEQMELAEVLLKAIGLDSIAEVMGEFEYETTLNITEDLVTRYIDEIADSSITMEQATGEYDLQKRIINRINFKLIKLQQRYLDGTLMDGLGYNN